MHSERVFTRHAVRGLKIVYGEKPSLFTQNIRAFVISSSMLRAKRSVSRHVPRLPIPTGPRQIVLCKYIISGTAHSSSDWGSDVKTGFGSSLIVTRPTLLVVRCGATRQ